MKISPSEFSVRISSLLGPLGNEDKKMEGKKKGKGSGVSRWGQRGGFSKGTEV